jgi:hypothetical protein
MSVLRNLLRTALPNEPVPPVISKILFCIRGYVLIKFRNIKIGDKRVKTKQKAWGMERRAGSKRLGVKKCN